MYALVDKNLKNLIKNKIIDSEFDLNEFIQPASIDIPVSDKAYLIKHKFLPFNKNVCDILKKLTLKTIDLNKPEILFKGQTYIVPCFKINLPKNKYIKISPKSSIGRIDILVRVIFDNSGLYDYIPEGSKGKMYLEITPQSFNIKLREGICISQMMVFENNKDNEIKDINIKNKSFLYDNNNKVIKNQCFNNNIILSLGLKQTDYGYQAKETNEVIDLEKRDIDWRDFFKEIKLSNKQNSKINLEKDKFYILSTKEKIMVPPKYSSEMIPFSHLIGELRAHYAGFFDPGFGYSKKHNLNGSKGTLEVRPHENITVYDGQPICFMEFFKNKSIPKNIYNFERNNYQGQKKAKLSKFFKKN